MSAESETTRGITKTQDTEKITFVRFKNLWAMVGEAGAATWSRAVIVEMESLARDATIGSEREVLNIVQAAFRSAVRNSAAPPIGTRDFQDFFCTDTNAFDLTIAFYFNHKPCLYVFESFYGIATPGKKSISLSGIGKDLAQYIFAGIDTMVFDSHSGCMGAAYVVNEVKRHISGCGGKTEVCVMSDGNKPERLAANMIDFIDGQTSMLSAAEKARRTSVLSALMGTAAMQYVKAEL